MVEVEFVVVVVFVIRFEWPMTMVHQVAIPKCHRPIVSGTHPTLEFDTQIAK